MNTAALVHRPIEDFVYPTASNKLIFRFQAARKDIKNCTLVCWRRYENFPKFKRIPMRCVLRDAYHDYFEVEAVFPKTACYIRYYFELSDGNQTVWYGRYGTQSQNLKPENDFFEYLFPNIQDGHQAPEWCKRQIYYQIFPDRFKNGDRTNDPVDVVPWDSVPTRDNVMGGDLAGILDRIDYLVHLGITCIYLNPIFKGYSNHKYDTIDYYKIDPQFGTEKDLLNLTEKCHEKGIRIILDGVFNHSGYYFPPFQDLLKNGNQSRYKNWFFPLEFPVKIDPPNYECVGYYKWMPKLNLANPETREYFINVGRYWIEKYGIDGWRLDVADEIEGRFWESFSASIKRDFPDTVLIGESWGDAGRLVLGNRLDGAMNYLFKDAVTGWLAKEKIDVLEFDNRINYMLSLYPETTRQCMYNLLDSHDTPRFLYDCGGDIRKLKLAVAFMMTFPGCPAIFYGDEIGLTGANDPDCRRAMPWDKDQHNRMLFDWYRQLIGIRKKYDTLNIGSFRTNICNPETGIYGFIRSVSDQNIYIVLNPSEQEQVVTVPLLDQQRDWLEMIEGETVVAERISNETGFYNQDIEPYKSQLKTNMAPYSLKIFIESGGKV
jgi:cyclomaltodextrinase / maltogenic alpha-amylase / neopullulanase